MKPRLSSTTLQLCPRSVITTGEVEYAIANFKDSLKLVLLAPTGSDLITVFHGEASEYGGRALLICPLSPHNAANLRLQHNWLRPRLLNTHTSAGMGDRLGIATPGHVRAARQYEGKIAPIFAQQSIREMTRTGRSPQQVMDDATWGIFEEGWQGGVGADADHLKTTQDIDACLAAGFTLFTIDPGGYVDDHPPGDESTLREKASLLPSRLWMRETGLAGKAFDLDHQRISVDEPSLLRAMVKYGLAIHHVARMYEHLQLEAQNRPFEVEISMDETELPTSPLEHIYIASELHRLGVKWVSFAPRFVGRFEKGVDFIGDVELFTRELGVHAAIARLLGPYKLSLHSGSDKFSIYDTFVEQTNGLAHLKTAGTSYLEALRTIAEVDPDLMREIYLYALQHFEVDKQSYLSSADLSKAPTPGKIISWTDLVDQFDAREILHVTYGSVLTERDAAGNMRFYDSLMSVLQHNRELYFDHLENHFRRHLEPFASSKRTS